MITCHLCGKSFKTVEDFEQHIDDDCKSITEEDTTEYVGTQILYPDGTSEFRKLYPKPSDEFLQRHKSDEDFTESKRVKTKKGNMRFRGIGRQFIDLRLLEIWEEDLRLSVMTKDEQLEYLIGEIEKMTGTPTRTVASNQSLEAHHAFVEM
jgi:hypothetical protein